jgi:hypothetical protein
MAKYSINSPAKVTELMEQLKQQIQAKAQRIRRFEKRSTQFVQNKLFKEDTKKLYRELGKKQIIVEEPPKHEEVEGFWKEILEQEKSYNDQAEWMKRNKKEIKKKS